MQLGFFDANEVKQPEPATDGADPDGLRWYQRECVESIQQQLRSSRSRLAVLATGTGKTQIFCIVAKEWRDGRVLVLAHRDELVRQAASRLAQLTGERVEIEQAGLRSSKGTRIVVGSTDTVRSERRLAALGPDSFGLVVADEAHRYIGNTYAHTLDQFVNAKVLGVTATPDRFDGRAMGQVFEDVAYCYDILNAIDDGWLVPLSVHYVSLEQIDISWVKPGRSEGGLAVGQLDEAMMPAVEGIVTETLRLAGDRHGICFFPGVRTAELACERFNALKPDSACFICGETPPERRRYLIDAFRKREFQYLCNCQVATEGFDCPEADLIVLGRPTKSRSLYAQMVGRGTRVLPRLVDHLPDKGDADRRRVLIAASKKPNCLVLDFVGNCGKHDLATAEDILGGSYSADELKLAKKKAKANPEHDPRDVLEQARSELKALAAKIAKSKVRSKVTEVNPFRTYQIDEDSVRRYENRFGTVPPTDKQIETLKKFGLPPDKIAGLTKRAASKLLDATISRARHGLATFKQLSQLQKHGWERIDITRDQASRGIDVIGRHGWGKRGPVPLSIIESAINASS